jgi:hypothetical protein
MKSLTSNLGISHWVRIAAAPLLPLAVFAAIMHGGNWLSLWPAPRPALDIDRAILLHQIEASRRSQTAEVVLLGDSSCLMDVDAARLERASGLSCLNLATISYLDLDHHRMLLESYRQANPSHPRIVLLLMHPASLRQAVADAHFARFFEGHLSDRLTTPRRTTLDQVEWVLGLDQFRERILARLIPRPLPGAFGTKYGFTSNLEEHMTRHQGSLIDPTRQEPRGNPEYQLDPALESKSSRLRRALPPTVKLVVGLTPLPEGFPFSDYPEVSQAMLTQWAQWLGADAALQELPRTLPAPMFATATHLNEEGARQFTDRLAELLTNGSL